MPGSPIGGATNNTYNATAGGNYTVIVTTLGCSSAASAATTVTVDYAAERVCLEVVNAAGAAPEPRGRAGGHGLVGMRERVGLFGGRLRTGPREEGGYQVSASFPLTEAAR